MGLIDINFEGMFPGLEHHGMRHVLHMCGIRDIQAQTRLIVYEGIEEVDQLAIYHDKEMKSMADRNSKRTPANTRICDLLPSSERSRSGVLVGDWVVQDHPRRSTHTNPGEQYTIHLARAFGVRSVSNVGRLVMLAVLNRCFLFDKPCASVPLQLMTGKSANETI